MAVLLCEDLPSFEWRVTNEESDEDSSEGLQEARRTKSIVA
jgi:hypothetical protein